MIIGIDAGGTWIKVGLFGDDLAIRDTVKVASGARISIGAYYDSIAEAVRQLTPKPAEAVIGFSAPGAFNKDRDVILAAPNVRGMEEGKQPVRFADELKKRLEVSQVAGDNDAGCAGLAEWMKGQPAGDLATSLLFLTWGTGIGSALIANGQNVYGWEAGHFPVSWESPARQPCGCGSHIDLEARIAVPRLLEVANMEPIALVDAAEAGREPAHGIIDEALRWMARGLHTAAVVGYPDQVVIGGGMMDRDWLLQQLRRHVTNESQGFLNTTLQPEQVHRATLGNSAGMIGAAVLAQQKFGGDNS